MSATVIHNNSPEVASRAALRRARRVCVKAGTSVVANPDGRPSLTRLGAIVEQICELVTNADCQVIFVSSGAVGMGKRLLRKQAKMSMSLKDIHNNNSSSDLLLTNNPTMASSQSFVSLLDLQERPHTLSEKKKHYDSACAAAGQFEMMNLYSSLFAQCDVAASQVLVTQGDFTNEHSKNNLVYAVERLLQLGIVPILNENDAVSANMGYTPDDVFSDNDSLAALCARTFGAEVLLLLTDVAGVYDRPPSETGAKLLPLYLQDTHQVTIGEKSSQGRGGMASKIQAASAAVKPGSRCSACVVASGQDLDSIRRVLGKTATHEASIGTLFCTPGSDLEAQAVKDYATTTTTTSTAQQEATKEEGEARIKAVAARREARKLLDCGPLMRKAILKAMAAALTSRQDELLEENAKDVAAAERDGIASVLQKRLKLTPAKLQTLSAGLEQLADLDDPLGVCKARRELSPGLELTQVTVPLGVLLIIFESRPDSMPQIAALALASGNGLLLKGGKEAVHSNAAIHKVLGDAIEQASAGKVTRDIVGLITSRSQVADMLVLDDVIDLVIPRGSNALVRYIQQHTRIPVLGHADGVCHLYVDQTASAADAAQIAVDAKTDYPSACNAMETLLLHQETVKNGVAAATLMALRKAGVVCLGGPVAMTLGLCDHAAEFLKYEYGDLRCMVEVVESMDQAIDWIHAHGSGHTETIVCSANAVEVREDFLRRVDAACVFANASSRFADGYRFGLGAEVGISTGRVHARGPVGVEGLLTTKWQLRSTNDSVHAVSEFAGETPKKVYTHKQLEK